MGTMFGQNTNSPMFRLNLMSRLLGVQSIHSIFVMIGFCVTLFRRHLDIGKLQG